jgi:hypothetical protein
MVKAVTYDWVKWLPTRLPDIVTTKQYRHPGGYKKLQPLSKIGYKK